MSTNPSQKAAYAELFERLLDPTFLIDPSTHVILEANPAAERVLGIPVEGLIGRALSDVVIDADREEFSKALRVALRRYHPRQFESHWLLPNRKQLVMDILACPMKLNDQNEVLQVIARDISFRRESEQRMQQLLDELKVANEKLQELSNTDGMTGLHNFRFFKQQLTIEHARASRYNDRYAIVFCDIDHFKHYNDRNGHPAGDDLLRKVAQIVRQACRASDLPARYGGEEFVVLCSGVNWEGAQVLAERIRSTVASCDLPFSKNQPAGALTLSIGVAAFPDHGTAADQVLETADQAMYYSKTHGRNQVTTAEQLKAGGQPPKKAA